MAEGLLRHLAGDRYEVMSAGTFESSLNPRAIRAMAELGVDISGHESKALDRFLDERFDLVVTVCDSAKESCPVFPGAARTVHWPFDDPVSAGRTEEEIMKTFRKVRDEIKAKLTAELVE